MQSKRPAALFGFVAIVALTITVASGVRPLAVSAQSSPGSQLSTGLGTGATEANRDATRVRSDIAISGPTALFDAQTAGLGGVGSGYLSLGELNGYAFRTYVVRVVQNPYMNFLAPLLTSAANQFSNATGLPIVIDARPVSGDRAPIDGEILVRVSNNSPCGALGVGAYQGCGGPSSTLQGKITAGKIWIGDSFVCQSFAQELILHEMGHVFGLDHYNDSYSGRTQVMSIGSFDSMNLRAGDIRGLGAIAGRAALTSEPVDPAASSNLSALSASPKESPKHSSVHTGAESVARPLSSAKVTLSENSENSENSNASAVGAPALYVSMPAQRVFDSRSGAPFAAGETRTVTLPAFANLPAGALDAVTANITAADSRGSGYVTVYPADVGVPATSNLNYPGGRDVANAAIIKVSGTRQIKIFNFGGPTHVLIDVSGGFSSSYPTTASGFVPLAPRRVLDTRSEGDPADAKATLAADERGAPTGCGSSRILPAGRLAVPAAATGLVLNVTADGTRGSGYVSTLDAVVPRGTEPATSTLNVINGDTRANLAFSGPTPNIRNSDFHTGDLIADLAGYFETRASAPTSSAFIAVDPERVLDTRSNIGFTGRMTDVRTLTVVPPAGIDPTKVAAVAMNLTVTSPLAGGYITSGPFGQALPNASNVNYATGETVANLAIIKVGPGLGINLYAFEGTPHLIGDVVGFFVNP